VFLKQATTHIFLIPSNSVFIIILSFYAVEPM
jgi:hypothetical protein